MKKIFFILTVSFFIKLTAQEKPKLVIGIVVDQMKMEYLYRFSDDFSNQGFKKLMKKGMVYHHMHYNYMATYTAPGHASIYTGTTPSIHGIVGNDWFNRATGKYMYCTDDESVKTLVTGTEKEGMMSPKNLLSTTITDELKMATNFRGKVIGLSLKDRGAILPAGHFANWAFWYAKTGDFISSSFYGEKLPDWLIAFNQEKRYKNYIDKGWNLLKPIEDYNESLPDDNAYEGRIDASKPPVFPYDLNKIFAKKGPDVIRTSPFGNDILTDLALRTIEMEGLGKDKETDFLTVSFSSTDYVGHTFGPRSIELQDTYLRLDLNIATLLNYLNKNVGRNNYVVFLTADHAAAENPTYLKDHKYNVTNFSSKDVVQSLKDFSNQTFGANLILNYSNHNLFFNKTIIKEKGLELTKVKQSFKDFLMTQAEVKRVYTEEEILASTGADYYLQAIFKGYDPKQNGDLVILNNAGFLEYHATGTTHGSPNSYDTNVPLIFYGWHIPNGTIHSRKVITQIAPSLSQILKIPFTNGTEGHILRELFFKVYKED